MGAKANRAYIACVKESQWGVTPGTPTMQKMNFTADSLNYALETTTPESIRDDRQTSDIINTSAGNEGGYEFEMQAEMSLNDELLVAALWADAWQGAATQKIGLEGAVITAPSQIDFSAALAGDPGFAVGDKFFIGDSALGNEGFFTVADVSGAPVYAVREVFATDETFGAGQSMYNSQWIINGLTEHSFTFERGHNDVTEFFLYTGMVVNEYNVTFEAGEVITGEFSFVGKDTAVEQAPAGAAYTDPTTNPFMSASFNVSNVLIDGVPVSECLIQSVEMNINNNVEGKLGVGVFGYCDVSEGTFELTGALNLYFNDSTFYQKFINSEAFSLEFTLTDNDGNAYIYEMPRCKLSADAVNVEGINTDVMDAAEYQALVDETLGYTIKVTRFMVAGL